VSTKRSLSPSHVLVEHQGFGSCVSVVGEAFLAVSFTYNRCVSVEFPFFLCENHTLLCQGSNIIIFVSVLGGEIAYFIVCHMFPG
jgi:hypothetical protein